MKQEEIEKAGREYESKIVVKDAYAHIHYEEGIKFANKHWQEKRWIPIDEKLPPRGDETRQVFVKNERKKNDYATLVVEEMEVVIKKG